jgi:signal transduction histidine kinase
VLELQTFHPDAHLEWRAEGDLSGEWDPDRLAQVVSNLIGNALQHGDGTGVRLAATGATDEVALTVHNAGQAIPAEVQASMFEPLARYAPTEVGSTSSIGLGLFIARAIVLAHGGSITVSSSHTGGTTFDVRLPRAAATNPPA